jgi:AraC family transcriptional regulator, regulatory protein of adaptative response / methylated-DNA-[protein]-cysteine methyltransferase
MAPRTGTNPLGPPSHAATSSASFGEVSPKRPSAPKADTLGTPGTLDPRWKPLAARDSSADGTFVYGVTSTGVYCRPSCPSRRPRADRVRFFDTTTDARQAGFRACKRCRPDTVGLAQPGVEAVRRASAYLSTHADQSVTLDHLSKVAAMSPHHLQRRFKAIVGLSPREYQAAVRADRLRSSLRDGRDVTTAIYEAGYGSPSRVYESPATGGMTPSSYRRGGAGMRIAFSIVASSLGHVLIAATENGVCAVRIGNSPATLERELRREYPAADIRLQEKPRADWLKAIGQLLRGRAPSIDLPVDVRATAFQWKVWRALQQIPAGETRAYADVARAIGKPSAVRAVARACATNPVALVVPCHRVVQTNGQLGGYRWGVERKARLLAAERRKRPVASR